MDFKIFIFKDVLKVLTHFLPISIFAEVGVLYKMLARYFFPAMNYKLMYFCFYSILTIQRDVNSNQKQTNTMLHLVVLFFVEMKYGIFNLLQDGLHVRLPCSGDW